jgi:carbon storage regulator
MLKLDRKVNETIMVGRDIEIKVVNIREDRVCLGIAAPKYVSVHRREVYDDIVAHGGAIGGTSDAILADLRKLIFGCVLFAKFRDKSAADEMALRINQACDSAGLVQVVGTQEQFGAHSLRYVWEPWSTDATKAKEGV